MRALILLLVLAAPPALSQPVEVDMELVLSVDISRSMSHVDLATQRRGYGEALTSEAVLDAIAQGPLGRIGLSYVEWSDSEQARVLVDWTLIDGPEAAADAAALIARETGGTLRETSISSGLLHSAAQFDRSPFVSWRRVIDISGDGPNNNGLPVTLARDRVLAAGITINGLPMMAAGDGLWSLPDLDEYYRDCVTGGPGAFVLPVRGWENFGEAIRAKMVLEIAGVRQSEPAGRLLQVAGYDCLIGEKIRDRRRRHSP